MYKKILVPLDGSENAESILPHVKDMAVAHQAEVILLKVLPATGVLPPVAEKEVSEARHYLSAVEKRLEAQGVNARFSLRHGEDTAAEIADYAEVNNVDLIAMSTHGLSGVSRWIFGSVAEKVLRGTNKPILLVRVPGISKIGLPLAMELKL